MSHEQKLLKKGEFFFIYDMASTLLLEDKTKRGLSVIERSLDEKMGVEAEKGVIHDMDGIGHRVGIRWYFPKSQFTFDDVLKKAEEIEERYRKIREMTCPD
ncbi:MAG: hypothetical protein QXU32_06220 [Nitrososphaerales archaeon]